MMRRDHIVKHLNCPKPRRHGFSYARFYTLRADGVTEEYLCEGCLLTIVVEDGSRCRTDGCKCPQPVDHLNGRMDERIFVAHERGV
jgi:hypothetical protein